MSREKHRADSRRWLLQAKADLRAARTSLKGGSFEWACFQAQQAGEKALKALWYFHSADPWGHSLLKLIQEFPVAAIREKLLELTDRARGLDRLYVPTRYPNGLPELAPADAYGEKDAREAIEGAETFIDDVCAMTS